MGEDECLSWAARYPSGLLSPHTFTRRSVTNDDVSIKITHCGVCYADVIWTRNKHGDSKYPLIPGHEIAGVVNKVGSNVDRFKVGDHVGVGTYVNSCRECEYCDEGQEKKLKPDEKYQWAIVDGVTEKVGNFNIEPPGLFRGRGEHPKDDDEADTVGCCTLKVENVECIPPDKSNVSSHWTISDW
ncbi:hypothetical protein AALP_AA6G163700 [Arabis alpina]|uniref:Uncharacterized protein n=1 Tax=Arabis alpina TaxID=50452 RepID=A0A087GPM6_ARAAL|nr:hypothetical protein AALP_AA6G163700 [Arabis alpina]